MRKYQEPAMELIRFEATNVVTNSPETLYPSTDKDDNGNSVGGSESGAWGGL